MVSYYYLRSCIAWRDISSLDVSIHRSNCGQARRAFRTLPGISTTAICSILISFTESVLVFYFLFCIARMNFAGPFDLGIYSAINNWFVRLRPQAVSIATLVQMVGLTAMPLIAYAAISFDGWRIGWIIIGATVFVIGFFPNFFLLHRSPEDIGLSPDGGPIKDSSKNKKKTGQRTHIFKSGGYENQCILVFDYFYRLGLSYTGRN